MMSANCFGLDQPAEGAHGVLEVLALGDRRLADLPGRHLHVLLAQDPDHVAGRQVPRLQLVGVQPHAHAVVLPAEGEDVSHALHPGQRILEMDGRVIAQVELVVIRSAGVGIDLGIQIDDQQNIRGPFLDGHADGLDHVGQRRLGDGHAVLHQHLGHVHVGAHREGHVQDVRAVVVALRRHVQHLLDADDLLLDRRGHRVGDDPGVGPGVAGRHADRGGRDLRVLGDGQEGRGDGPQQDDDDGDRPGQDGAVDEETSQHENLYREKSEIEIRNPKPIRMTKPEISKRNREVLVIRISTFEFVSDFGFRISDLTLGMSTSFGSTVMPGRTSCRPLTITRSPAFRPSSIARSPSCSDPTRMGRETTSFLSLTTYRIFWPWSVSRRGR